MRYGTFVKTGFEIFLEIFTLWNVSPYLWILSQMLADICLHGLKLFRTSKMYIFFPTTNKDATKINSVWK